MNGTLFRSSLALSGKVRPHVGRCVGRFVGRSIEAAAIAFVLSLGLSAKAGFSPPKKLSESNGSAIQCRVGVDLSFNAYIAWTAGKELKLDLIANGFSRHITLSDPGQGSGDPAIVTSTLGMTFIAFTQDDPVRGGREICLASNPGGSFTARPENVSLSPGDDYAPRSHLDLGGLPHLVWARRLGNQPEVMYMAPGAKPVAIARGDYPALAVDAFGTAHVVYTRGRDLYSVDIRQEVTGAEAAVTRTPFDDEFFPSIAVTHSGKAFVIYERKGGLYYHESIEGTNRYLPPRLLDNGGVSIPELKVTGDLLSIIYEKHGDLYYILGKVGSVLPAPVRVAETPEVETHPSMAVDPRGSLHIAYIRDGEVYYTNNVGELKAAFTVDRREGEAPLQVHFDDLSSGLIEAWRWDFGDGSAPSYEVDPTHVYDQPGDYSVTLTVFGGGAEIQLKQTRYIFVQTASYRIWIPDMVVYPGQKEIWCPVMAAHKKPLDGFQTIGVFDPNVLTLRQVTFLGTILDSYSPEFEALSFSNSSDEAYFFAGIIFDYSPPFSEHPPVLPPSSGERIAHLVFDCSEDAPEGGITLVEPKNGVGPTETHNAFAVRGQTTGSLPVLAPSSVSILVLGQGLPTVFKRGDSDGNGDVDLSDAIVTLGYLFLGDRQPSCLDAADVNDSGAVDIADPIGLLSFAFLGGTAPGIPFPGTGLDPSSDSLEECRR